MRQKRQMAAVMALFMALAACTLFQKDPVGASLLTIKTGYENSVRTAGRLYINRIITGEQLKAFAAEAQKFYTAYTVVVALHEAGKLPTGDAMIDQLSKGLTALEALLEGFSKKGS